MALYLGGCGGRGRFWFVLTDQAQEQACLQLKQSSQLTGDKRWQKMVDRQVKKASLEYLLSKIKSKGKENMYGSTLKCQGYLMPNKILTLEEQLGIIQIQNEQPSVQFSWKQTN